jgi:hypothetical protein
MSISLLCRAHALLLSATACDIPQLQFIRN